MCRTAFLRLPVVDVEQVEVRQPRPRRRHLMPVAQQDRTMSTHSTGTSSTSPRATWQASSPIHAPTANPSRSAAAATITSSDDANRTTSCDVRAASARARRRRERRSAGLLTATMVSAGVATVGLEIDEVPGPPPSRPHGQHQPADMPPPCHAQLEQIWSTASDRRTATGLNGMPQTLQLVAADRPRPRRRSRSDRRLSRATCASPRASWMCACVQAVNAARVAGLLP